MKTYRGMAQHGEDEGGAQVVTVQEDGGPVRPLIHRVRHSPDGFQWGYCGSGPADLARSILWDYLGREPLPSDYQAFKFSFVAAWPLGQGWTLTSDQIERWYRGKLGLVDA